MPTRDELLAGFVPQNTAVRECMICQQEPPNNPVTTHFCRCRVVYCRDCLLYWFERRNECCTCPAIYYENSSEDEDSSENEDSSESEESSDDDGEDEDGEDEDQEDEDAAENVPGPFELPVTIKEVNRPSGGPPIRFYLLNSVTGAAERSEALEIIMRFRAFAGAQTREVNGQAPQPSASIEACLMIDAFLQDAMIIYGSAITQIPWNGEIGSIEKFIKLVTSLGQAIIQLDGRRDMTSLEVGRELCEGALVGLRSTSPGLAETYERYLEQDMPRADWDLVGRYLPHLAKKNGESGGADPFVSTDVMEVMLLAMMCRDRGWQSVCITWARIHILSNRNRQHSRSRNGQAIPMGPKQSGVFEVCKNCLESADIPAKDPVD